MHQHESANNGETSELSRASIFKGSCVAGLHYMPRDPFAVQTPIWRPSCLAAGSRLIVEVNWMK